MQSARFYGLAFAIILIAELVTTGLQVLGAYYPTGHPVAILAANLSGVTLGGIIMVIGFLRDNRLEQERKRTEAAETLAKEERKRAEAAETLAKEARERTAAAEMLAKEAQERIAAAEMLAKEARERRRRRRIAAAEPRRTLPGIAQRRLIPERRRRGERGRIEATFGRRDAERQVLRERGTGTRQPGTGTRRPAELLVGVHEYQVGVAWFALALLCLRPRRGQPMPPGTGRRDGSPHPPP